MEPALFPLSFQGVLMEPDGRGTVAQGPQLWRICNSY